MRTGSWESFSTSSSCFGKARLDGPGLPRPIHQLTSVKIASHICLIFVMTRQEIHLSHCVWKRVKKTSPRNQDKPQSCLILSHLQGNFVLQLYLTFVLSPTFINWRIRLPSVWQFCHTYLLRHGSYLLGLIIRRLLCLHK